MSSNYPELVFNEQDDFTAARLNKAMQVLDQRLRSLEPFTPSWEASVNELRLFGLARLNETIQPAYDRVLQLADFGFLVAESNTSLTLVQDADATFIINDGPQRDLFTPTPFLVITRSDVATDYATSKLKSYDRDSGQLVVTIQTIAGSAGPFTDWWIGPLAGNTLSSIDYLTQIKAAKDTAVAAKNTATANATQTALDRAQTGADVATTTTKANAASTSAANAAASEAAAAVSAASVDANNLLTKDGNLAGIVDKVAARTNLELAIATVSELRSKANSSIITNDKAWNAAQWVDLGAKTGAVSIDANAGVRFIITLIGNVTIDVINLKNGQPIELHVQQDATGGRTVSWSSKFLWPSGAAPEVATAASTPAVFVSGVASWDGNNVWAAGWKVTA